MSGLGVEARVESERDGIPLSRNCEYFSIAGVRRPEVTSP